MSFGRSSFGEGPNIEDNFIIKEQHSNILDIHVENESFDQENNMINNLIALPVDVMQKNAAKNTTVVSQGENFTKILKRLQKMDKQAFDIAIQTRQQQIANNQLNATVSVMAPPKGIQREREAQSRKRNA